MDAQRERDLIGRAPQDAQAFRELYQHYLPRVYAYVAYRVGHAQDTEDLVAEIFLKMLEGLPRFEPRHDGAFAAWLWRIAHNRVSNFHRDHATALQSLDDLPDLPAGALLPDDLLLRQEQFVRLYGLIAALPPRRREVITLKFFGGLANREIAAVLGLDERTVASHLCRALDDLHRHYIQPDEAIEAQR